MAEQENLSMESTTELHELDPETIERLKTPETLQTIQRNKQFIQSGNWTKEARLGLGGQTEVFLLRDSNTKNACVLRNERLQMGTDCEKIKTECEILLLLKHPRVVDYLDFNVDTVKYRVKLYMEAMKCNLLDYIKTKGHLLEAEAVNITRDILEGLAFIHKSGIIHRDLKSSNVLLDEHGRAKITDFGISKFMTNPQISRTRTPTISSVQFMSPEAIKGRYSAKSDVWSVGCMIVHMLSGNPPNSQCKEAVQVLLAVASYRVDFQLPEDTSKNMKNLIDCLLTKVSSERPGALEALGHPALLV